jgi:hypothetical protein
LPNFRNSHEGQFVIPAHPKSVSFGAKAEIQKAPLEISWIPAFAGMTDLETVPDS